MIGTTSEANCVYGRHAPLTDGGGNEVQIRLEATTFSLGGREVRAAGRICLNCRVLYAELFQVGMVPDVEA